MFTGLTIALLAACRADTPTVPEGVFVTPASATVHSDRVDDLAAVAVTDSTVELRWTQVEDGRGRPALYRLKFSEPAIQWATAEVGCNAKGSTIGAPISCTVRGLDESTVYDFQLMSYRLAAGKWQGATYSNVAKGQTSSSRILVVSDLTATGVSSSSLRVDWTQVDDGTGNPARYRVRYATPPMDWSTAAIGCDTTLDGARIGDPMSCTISGLAAGASYDVQLMSYHVVDGLWQDTELSNVASGSVLAKAQAVSDLAVTAVTDSSLIVLWTETSDGTGGPASYRVRYAPPTFSWSSAADACGTVAGTTVGAQRSCTIRGLSADRQYTVQVMSYRDMSGAPDGESFSNLADGRTSAPTAVQQASSGIWISKAELAQLPMSGTAWNNVLSAASKSCGSVDLTDQEQSTNVCVLAKALVFARTGITSYRSAVVTAISQIVGSGTYVGRALSLGRELGAYVVAADLIDLKSYNATLDASFRSKLRTLRTTYTSGAASSLIDCHEKRPNNWGAHCGATRAAIAVYLGDTADLARTAQVFKGFLGDRSSYAGFEYGDDLSWQCDPTRPVGINRPGCVKSGHVVDGIIPDDQRRSGTWEWPAPHENYVWESLQGLLSQAWILSRAGYPVWDWENRALLRAVKWVHDENGFPAEGDDRWLVHIVNRAYGTSYPAATPTTAGKNFGWTDWTHR